MPLKDKEERKRYNKEHYQNKRDNPEFKLKRSESGKKSYQKNKEKIKKHQQKPEVKARRRKQRKEYYLKNKENWKKYRKKFRESLKGKEYHEQYYYDHKEEILEQHRGYNKISRVRERKNKNTRERNKRLNVKLKNSEYGKERYKLPEVKKRIKKSAQKPENKTRKNITAKGYRKKKNEEENKRRKKFRLPLIGEGYEKENELFVHVCNLFPHHRPKRNDHEALKDWGRKGNRDTALELDVYIPELNLAFEYMGEQHYRWIKFFHITKKEFEKQLVRDKCKKRLCKIKGIALIKIKYNEKLSEQLILTKLKNFPSLITTQMRVV